MEIKTAKNVSGYPPLLNEAQKYDARMKTEADRAPADAMNED